MSHPVSVSIPPSLAANAGVINSAGDFVAVSSKDRKRAAAEAFLRRQLEDAERAARDAAAERARLATYSEADAQRERDEAAQRALDEAAAAKQAHQLAKAERIAAREREAAEAEAAAKQVLYGAIVSCLICFLYVNQKCSQLYMHV